MLTDSDLAQDLPAWPEVDDPWQPPLFVERRAWDALHHRGQAAQPSWRWCASADEAVARAAGCAWARAAAGVPAQVGVVAAGTATAQTLSRARILAGDRVRISELAPEAECPQHQPPSALQPMPVDLLQLAPECVPPWDAQGPAETPWDACRAALQALAAVEPALVIAGDVAPWQPLDQWALVALAQVAAEGRRVVLLRPDPAVLASLAARLADLQLHCVVLTDHPEAPGDDRWWWTEAADQAQALAQLRTALWVEGLWCLRVPSRWCQGLTEPGPWAEPGAQRTVMAGKGPLLVASCGYLDQAQRLGAESGGALSVLHASSLQPGPVGPWAALEGDPVLAACGGGTPVPASLAGLRAWLGSDGHS